MACIGAGIALALSFKHIRNMSHAKQIFDGLKENGIPERLALLIVAQSKHETTVGGVAYMSKQFIVNNNAFGYGHVPGNPLQIGSGGMHPEDSGVYAKYKDLAHCIDDISGWYTRRKATFFNITDTNTFANKLKGSGYYTDSVLNYSAGVKRNFQSTII